MTDENPTDGQHRGTGKPLLKCSICGNDIDIEPISGWSQGHNAQPINDGRCCTQCNTDIVIPTRIREMQRRHR